MTTKTNSIEAIARSIPSLFKKPETGEMSDIYRDDDLSESASIHQETDPGRAMFDKNRQIQALEKQVYEQQLKIQRLLALNQFSQEFGSAPDFEQSAYIMARLLYNLYHCAFIGIYHFRPIDMQFKLLAATGPFFEKLPGRILKNSEPPFLNQVIQTRSLFSISSTTDGSSILFHGNAYQSFVAVPLVGHKELYGFILLADSKADIFQANDNEVIEAAAVRLASAWELAQRGNTLTDFIQSISSFSNVQETGSLMERIASVACTTLKGNFAVVAKKNQQGWQLRSSGKAPLLFHSLKNGAAIFLEEAIKAPYTFRLRDLRNDKRSAIIQLDSDNLCSLLACPIQTNGQNTGLILVFGKQDENAFLESDVLLAELLSENAAMNLESCFLNQELRTNLETTQLLYRLSLDISQAEDLNKAISVIAQTALKLMQAHSCGLVMYGNEGSGEISLLLPGENGGTHPYPLIQQAMDSQQTIYLADNDHTTRIAIPIQTPRRCYGALWIEIHEALEEEHHPAEEIRVLVNQASVALERLVFLEETRRQAQKLEAINLQLEESYHQTLKALMRALDARDSDTEGHSERVNELADMLGKEMGLSEEDHKALLLGSLLHDIGKIAVPDHILHKRGPLDPDEWNTMRKHPENGVEIIQEIDYLNAAIPVIHFHQERWDGSGYPQRRVGEQIPLLARIFAVVDVFDALTRNRPYRKHNFSTEEAVDFLEKQAGIQFDKQVVDKFIQVIRRVELQHRTD